MPPSNISSARFKDLYDALPQSAQQKLVERHLIPLLNQVPKKRALKTLGSAVRLRKLHSDIPSLDLKAKKAEIQFLLDELTKDSKRSYVMDVSNKPEILGEIMASLTDWFCDIWCLVYEHHTNYNLAHDCLLFISDTLTRLANVRSCCKCSLTNMYLPVTIKSSSGKTIRSFHIDGAENIEVVAQFIWRDLFLSLLARGTSQEINQIQRMLKDIERVMEWRGLVNVLNGGRKDPSGDDYGEDKSEDWDDVDDDEDEREHDDWDDDASQCRHWSPQIFGQLPRLHAHVQRALRSIFEDTPSTSLYNALLKLSPHPKQTETELLASLKHFAVASPDTFAVTLEIYAQEARSGLIIELLDSHSHLLRPRDAKSLQLATKTLANAGHLQRAMTILQTELMETARTIRETLLVSYSQMDTPANKTELNQILRLHIRSPARRHRIESWVDSITSPGVNVPNPMLFAAMLMGMPPMPGMNSDDDPYTYLDLDPHDPDLEDLRHEYRPALKHRFESWADLGLAMKNGPSILLVVYKDLIEKMPFLRASDATEEMITRLQDRPSKQYVCEGLDALLAFAKVQRRKWNLVKSEVQKRKDLEAKAAAGASPNRTSESSSSGSPATPLSPQNNLSPPPKPVSVTVPTSSPMASSSAARASGGSNVRPSSSNLAPSTSNTTPASSPATTSSNTNTPSGLASYWPSASQLDSILRAPSPSPSYTLPSTSTQAPAPSPGPPLVTAPAHAIPQPAQPPTNALPLTAPFSFFFGAGPHNGPPPPGPSLDDVD